jgi:hypothetical protein
VRTALTILVIVALALLAVGAVNHAVTLDLDFLAVSWNGVSLFWVMVAVAALVVVVGLVAAWAARGSAAAAQRRLEKELGSTYGRLRAAQAAVAEGAAAVAPVVDEVTVVAPPGEEATEPAVPEAAPLDAEPAAATEPAAAVEPAPGDMPGDMPGEVTAVTVVAPAVPLDEAAGPQAAEESGPDEVETDSEVTAATVVTPSLGPDEVRDAGPATAPSVGPAEAERAPEPGAPDEPAGGTQP